VLTVLFSMLSHPFTILLCVMNALVIYEDVTEHEAFSYPLRVVSKLTIITNAYNFLGLLYFAPPLPWVPMLLAGLSLTVVPFAIGVAYVVLRAGMGPMGAIDKAVVSLLVAGHVPQIAMAAVARWYVNPRAWRAWLETYDPAWEPSKTDWLLRIVLKMTEGWREWLD